MPVVPGFSLPLAFGIPLVVFLLVLTFAGRISTITVPAFLALAALPGLSFLFTADLLVQLMDLFLFDQFIELFSQQREPSMHLPLEMRLVPLFSVIHSLNCAANITDFRVLGSQRRIFSQDDQICPGAP
jgi:hypothetical protein